MKLYDQFGREITVEKKPEMREIAAIAIRDRWSDYPSKGLTPQKLAEIFREADQGDVYRQAELFEEMEEKDTHLFSEIQKRKSAVLSFDYEIQPYSESADDKKIAESLEDNLYNLPKLEDAMLDLLDAVGKGFAMFEPIYDIVGKQVILKDLSWIHQKRAVFYDRLSGGIWQKSYEMPRILTEAEQINGEIMPPFKLIYHRYKARSGYDTRAGILRVCAWMYLFKNYAIKDWVAFAEVFGIPLRVGKYEPGAGKPEKDALITAIQSIGTDAAGIISKNTEIEFIETTKGSSQDNIFNVLAEFCDKQMSKAILGQTLTTQEGDSGSYALGKIHNLVRQDLTRADSESLSKTIRFQIFRPLVGWNFGWDKPLPWFKIMYEPSEDLQALSEVYKGLSEIGFPLTAEHISERFKVPVPKDGETILTKPAPQGLPFAMKKIVAKNSGIESEDVWIEAYLKRISPSLKQVKASALKEVETYLRKQTSPPSEEEFVSALQGILGDSYKKIDQTAVTDAVADVYKNYKLVEKALEVAYGFGGADIRAINFLAKLDHFYLSKFLDNPDAASATMEFLKTRYLEGGEGLFGAGEPKAIAELKNLLSQHMTDLEGYQVRRIVETAVQRDRNWAHISQMHDAGIIEIEIVEPTQECPFCAAMNGQVIQVDVGYQKMIDQSNMSAEEYENDLRSNQPTWDDSTKSFNVEDFVDQGILPPYHPHCRGRIIKRIIQ